MWKCPVYIKYFSVDTISCQTIKTWGALDYPKEKGWQSVTFDCATEKSHEMNTLSKFYYHYT